MPRYTTEPRSKSEIAWFRGHMKATTPTMQQVKMVRFGKYGSSTVTAAPTRFEKMSECSKCGKSEEDSDWGLIDISVITADGEEGFAYVTQLVCDDCFKPLQESLIKLGFVDHRHGGINFLEDETCCNGKNAYDNCPTPSEYGQYVVLPPAPHKRSED
jgi:hypothetical protein